MSWAAPGGATLTVEAGEQVYVATALTASADVTVTGGTPGADDGGLGVVVDTAGGLTSAGLRPDGAGGHVGIHSGGDLEVMGNVVSGATVRLAPGGWRAFEWSTEPSDVRIEAAGRAYVGGHTVNAFGEPNVALLP